MTYAPVDTSDSITGEEIMAKVQVRLRESQSTTAQQQSMLYQGHIRHVLDEIARKTWTIYNTAVTDIVANQLDYIIPHRPVEIRTVRATDGFGNVYNLAGITEEEANRRFWNWDTLQNGTPQWTGPPQFYIMEGVNRFVILPTPNFNAQAGLIVRGYYGVDKWYQMDMPLPLKEGMDECVELGVSWRRCIEMATQDPMYSQMMPIYKAEYRTLLCRHYGERIRESEASRNTIPSNGSVMGWGAGWSFGVGW